MDDSIMEVDGVDGVDGVEGVDGVDGEDGVDGIGGSANRHSSPRRGYSRAGPSSEGASTSVTSSQHSPAVSNQPLGPKSSASAASTGKLLHTHMPEGMPEGTRAYSTTPIPLTHEEAILVHHYTEYLGRWLDCTDATRQFTLGVPEKLKLCPVLCHAVLSFAARHRRDAVTADNAYQRCIALLIERLDEDAASHDETLLCAIVILRFYEQLNGMSELWRYLIILLTLFTVPSSTGSDEEQHLAGCSAIIRTSQGHHFVDPSAPTLREAAFWVYVRQCLYNATINQLPLDIDFSLQLHPTPGSMRDAHPLARLRLETAWANQMTWNIACVVNFCYEPTEPLAERAHRVRRWHELWDLVQAWLNDRPEGFNPIFEGHANDSSVLPDIWFTADWHGMFKDGPLKVFR